VKGYIMKVKVVTPAYDITDWSRYKEPVLVRDSGYTVYLTLPLNPEYYTYERDAIIVVSNRKENVGSFVKALNLENCKLWNGKVELSNE
jgi:hypothetical protein